MATMRVQKLRLVCGMLVACLGHLWQAQPVLGYGPIGHRVVAEIASLHLNAETKIALEKILGNEFMAELATWPDEMRSSPDTFWKMEANPYHYINVPAGQTYEDSVKNPAGDAITALEKFSAIVKDTTTTAADRRQALAFVIHIVGDLHQPLHVGKPEDWGGNKIEVVWFEEMTNLHLVWDEHLITHKQLSYSEWTHFLNQKITADQVREWQNSVPIDWVHEDLVLRDDIYENGKGILSWDYVYRYTPLIKSQLSKAGIRLAGYLNMLFSEPAEK